MQAPTQRSRLPLLPLLPAPMRPWAQPIEPVLQRLLIPPRIIDHVDAVRRSESSSSFAAGLLASLRIRFQVDERDVSRIPKVGPAVIVANHPFGILDGLVLMALLSGVRRDTRIMANSLLAAIPEIGLESILVNPFEAAPENHASLRRAIAWLSGGGVLAIFPAGEVAHANWRDNAITDPEWKTAAARLAMHAACPAVPVYFEGANSLGFQLAGALHPALRTVSLAREFYRMRGKTVRLRIGSPVPHSFLAHYGDPERATGYLRSRTYFLSNRPAATPPKCAATSPQARAVAPPESMRRLSEEVNALPAECQITENRDFTVYLARAEQIPTLLSEIGRSRELCFREVGEGTGESTDLDRFDAHYQHLILWSKKDGRLAGGYRLAFTPDVLPAHGVKGLYTSTLFRYHRRFFDAFGPAVELGRSFIMPEYQRGYASLLLLWRGILRAVARRPGARCLFGAVSISREYGDASRRLIAAYLAERAAHPLRRWVAPRCGLNAMSSRDTTARRLAEASESLEEIAAAIADIELDSKGVPVLLRQYLKAGGRLLGVNVDREFSGVLDALMVVDLDRPLTGIVERCMGVQ